MRKEFINALNDRITAQCPSVQHVARVLFNDQFNQEKKETAFRFPATFVELTSIDYRSETNGSQKIDLEFAIIVGFHALRDTLDILDIIQEISLSLHGFAGDYFSNISRIRSTPDGFHDNVTVWKIFFKTTLTDELTFNPRQLVLAGTPGVVINRNLDIDNPIIRSGDGQ